MRAFSMILFAAGFLASALVAVMHADAEGLERHTVNWMHYSLAFVVGVAGVIGLRSTAAGNDTGEEKLDGDLETLHTSLTNIVNRLTALHADSETISVYDVHRRIDDEFVNDLGAFVEARESMIPRFGLQPYADIMSLFAGGERLLNRTWSASADGYVDEVWSCLSDAEQQMKTALELFEDNCGKAASPE